MFVIKSQNEALNANIRFSNMSVLGIWREGPTCFVYYLHMHFVVEVVKKNVWNTRLASFVMYGKEIEKRRTCLCAINIHVFLCVEL